MAFRTDLAVEAIENRKAAAALRQVRQSERTLEGFSVSEVEILAEDAARELGKPCGRYVTLSLDALIRREEDAFPRACRALSTLLRDLLPARCVGPVLVAGLGNRSITPDAVGPIAADHVIATRHLVEQEPDVFAAWRPVSVLAPGVLGQTGVETGELIEGVLDRIRPAAVIAVDALAAGRLSRLLRTVQLADTGITPGAGVGNARAALCQLRAQAVRLFGALFALAAGAVDVFPVVLYVRLQHRRAARLLGGALLDASGVPLLLTVCTIASAVGAAIVWCTVQTKKHAAC